MRTDDLDFPLPPELIAQTPAEQRESARLLVTHLADDTVEHRTAAQLPSMLRRGDLLVINDTRVLPARIRGRRASTGGSVEGLFLQTRDDAVWQVMLRSGGRLTAGERIRLRAQRADDGANHELQLLQQQDDGTWLVKKHSPLDTTALLEAIGLMPLPPYIDRQGELAGRFDALDRMRYQTVYAQSPGAVAAPTAGLHLTDHLLAELAAGGIHIARLTLHVGMGTFAPVRTATLDEHPLHTERFTIPAQTIRAVGDAHREGRRIIAVGTTSVRALESLPDPLPSPDDGDYKAETRLLIQPGFRFRHTGGLLTNFHLPRSTLLALVAAMTGLERLKRLYALAVEQRYRFFSYGDAMLILP